MLFVEYFSGWRSDSVTLHSPYGASPPNTPCSACFRCWAPFFFWCSLDAVRKAHPGEQWGSPIHHPAAWQKHPCVSHGAQAQWEHHPMPQPYEVWLQPTVTEEKASTFSSLVGIFHRLFQLETIHLPAPGQAESDRGESPKHFVRLWICHMP